MLHLGASLWQRTGMHQFTLSTARRYIPALAPGLGLAVKTGHTPVPVWSCDGLTSRQIADIEKYSVPALTHYEDRNSMAHSLEGRHPFLDPRLGEFLLNLPPYRKIRNSCHKPLLSHPFTP